MRAPLLLLPACSALLAACAPAAPTSARSSATETAPAATSAPVVASNATTTGTSTASGPAPSAQTSADPFACAADADCSNSCRHGAVNKRWWQEQYPGDEACEDGCTSKGTDAPRCEQGGCVAYARGKPNDACTRRKAEVVAGPGPAHRCTTDADCKVSCRYGAVNAAWYSYGARGDCKDGCEEGTTAVHCETGLCVAWSGTRRNAGCTARSIHER